MYDEDDFGGCCCRQTIQLSSNPTPACDTAKLDTIICNQQTIICNQMDNLANQQIIIGMLANGNPVSLSANFPEEREDGVYYKTQQLPSCCNDRFIVFRDMLNPNLFVLFKGVIPVAKPVYYVDGSNFAHNVTTSPGGPNVLADQLVNNAIYPALYLGNDIIITL